MTYYIKIDVKGTNAILTEMPRLAEGVKEPIELLVTFDQGWTERTPHRAVLWREGDAVLKLELDQNGSAFVPHAFAGSEKPFYIRITGKEDGSFSTNELCASFFDLYSAEATEPCYTVPSGSYTLTQNGTYFGENTLLARPVQVNVPFNADTTEDTVTAETLHAGVTAHDAKGNSITGTFVPAASWSSSAISVVKNCFKSGANVFSESSLTVKA